MELGADDPADTSGVTFKLLMSYNQMLRILGIFKARGTAVFRTIVGWPASVVGGDVTRALFVKCAFQSPLYVPFILTMSTPLVAFVCTCALIGPKTLFERKQEAQRELDGVVPPPPDRARCVPVASAGGCIDRFLAQKVACWRRVALDDAARAEWSASKAAAREVRFSPGLRLASVTVFLLYSLYPTLIQAAVSPMRCSAPIGGKRYLVEDLAKECYTPEHFFFLVVGVISMLFYAAGIPLTAFILIWRFRAEIARNDVAAMGSIGFLVTGYSTTRGGFVMAWEVLVMVRKLCIVVLGIVDLSGTVQVLSAILLLVAALVLQINVRPYKTLWLNLLDEGSVIVLITTQTISLVYLDLDARALTTLDTESFEYAATETTITILLIALNAVAFGALALALAVAACRHYGPKVGCCRPEGRCARSAAKLLDEEWLEVAVSCSSVELVWRSVEGAAVAAPLAIALKWRNEETDVIVEPLEQYGRIQAPPLGHALVGVDEDGQRVAFVDATPAWRDVATQKIVPLTAATRSRVEWRNTRTGAVSRVRPVVFTDVAPAADAAPAEGAPAAAQAPDDAPAAPAEDAALLLADEAPSAGADAEGGAAQAATLPAQPPAEPLRQTQPSVSPFFGMENTSTQNPLNALDTALPGGGGGGIEMQERGRNVYTL